MNNKKERNKRVKINGFNSLSFGSCIPMKFVAR